MKNSSFKDFVLEQVGDLGDLQCRYMFGDWGLYCDEVFFAIVAEGRLYFRTDSASRQDYLEMGMEPFRPNPGQTLKSYYEVPVDVIEDRERLTAWARKAVRSERRKARGRSPDRPGRERKPDGAGSR